MGKWLVGAQASGARLQWTTGSTGLRPGAFDETRYVRPSAIHPRAVLIVTATPFLATLALLCVGFLRG